MIVKLFAVLCTADVAMASDWYAKLFGRPADRTPMPSLREWDVAGAGLQLYEDAEKAGPGVLTLFVQDLAAARADLASRGLTLGEASAGGGSRLAQIADPEGNTINLIEAV